jgi:hypothetical protein
VKIYVYAGVAGLFAILFGYILFGNPDVSFRTSDANWADSEINSKGRDFESIVFNFERYKLSCSAPEAVLLRTTPRIWINVFAWPAFASERKWRVPYADAVPEIGTYYPPAGQRHCYNEGASLGILNAAQANAVRYLNAL